ncbi:MAG: hypothetical protein ACYC0T_07895 [Ramlibacter sp.]
MNRDHLLRRHPRLFAGKALPRIDLVDDHGWLPILDRLFFALEAEFDDEALRDIEIVAAYSRNAELVIEERAQVRRMRNLCRLAEQDSARMCERCGADRAYLRRHSQLRTLCEHCAVQVVSR